MCLKRICAVPLAILLVLLSSCSAGSYESGYAAGYDAGYRAAMDTMSDSLAAQQPPKETNPPQTDPPESKSTTPNNNRPAPYVKDQESVIMCDYVLTCPFEVKLSQSEQNSYDFFIFLEYVCPFPDGVDPDTVVAYVAQGNRYGSDCDSREPDSYAIWKQKKYPDYDLQDNLGIYLSSTTTFTTDVPPGCYRLWYCSGKTWCGHRYFGNDTVWYTSDDILTFYEYDGYVYGQTVTLYKVHDGNMDTYEVSTSELPDALK